jgi:hypothetical protein
MSKNGLNEHNGNGHAEHGISQAILTTRPIVGSHKIYVDGAQPGVRVPFREIPLTPAAHSAHNGHANQDTANQDTPEQPSAHAQTVIVYDTSGPYTDPKATIDVRQGITPSRLGWIMARGDVEELAERLLFAALYLSSGTIQYVILLLFGISVMLFLAGAAAVTQDVIHPGLRATSYAIAVVVQNLLGASTAPLIMGRIYDLSNIQTAFAVLPFILVVGSILFYMGSRHYVEDLAKVPKIKLEVAE